MSLAAWVSKISQHAGTDSNDFSTASSSELELNVSSKLKRRNA
jgi:hypothetical protein